MIGRRLVLRRASPHDAIAECARWGAAPQPHADRTAKAGAPCAVVLALRTARKRSSGSKTMLSSAREPIHCNPLSSCVRAARRVASPQALLSTATFVHQRQGGTPTPRWATH